jgi:hypothetical protein
MKKAFLVVAAAALFVAASPAFAGDHSSLSFGVVVGDGGYRGPPRYHAPCPDDYRYRSYYGRPYGYGPRERVVIIDRGREHWRREHWRHYRDWGWR